MKKAYVSLSFDDGAKEDLRLVKLLKEYDMPATLYVSRQSKERERLGDEQIRKLGRQMEIGAHGINHLDLTRLTRDEVRKEVREGKRWLEELLGREVTSFAYPQGKVSQLVKQEVSLAGFEYGRGVRLGRTGMGDLLKAGTTVHAYDHHPLVYVKEGVKVVNDWTELAERYLDQVLREGGVFHLWGHSWEIEKRGDWQRLEQVLKLIKQKTKQEQRVVNGELSQIKQAEVVGVYERMKPEVYAAWFKSGYYKQEERGLRQLVGEYDKAGKRVMEIGSGSGRLSQLFDKAEYVGIEMSSGLVNWSRKNYGSKRVRFVEGDFKHRLKEMKQVDLVLLWRVFEAEDNPWRRVMKLKEKLRDKGSIVMSLNHGGNGFNWIGKRLMRDSYERSWHRVSQVRQMLGLLEEELEVETELMGFGLVPGFRGFKGVWGGKVRVELGVNLVVKLRKL